MRKATAVRRSFWFGLFCFTTRTDPPPAFGSRPSIARPISLFLEAICQKFRVVRTRARQLAAFRLFPVYLGQTAHPERGHPRPVPKTASANPQTKSGPIAQAQAAGEQLVVFSAAETARRQNTAKVERSHSPPA